MFNRASEDEPRTFGTFVHHREKDPVVRSHKEPKEYPKKKAKKGLNNDIKLDVEELWRNVVEPNKKRPPLKWTKRIAIQEDLKPMDEEQYQKQYDKRKGAKDIRVNNYGANPYFNPVSTVSYVGDYMQ